MTTGWSAPQQPNWPYQQLELARRSHRRRDAVAERLDRRFCHAVDLVHGCRGSLIVSGWARRDSLDRSSRPPSYRRALLHFSTRRKRSRRPRPGAAPRRCLDALPERWGGRGGPVAALLSRDATSADRRHRREHARQGWQRSCLNGFAGRGGRWAWLPRAAPRRCSPSATRWPWSPARCANSARKTPSSTPPAAGTS